jgi:predicted AAA+ superfamily ATPase
MYYKRLIDKYLENWKDDPFKKPLLLRGARQVGKSSTIRELGKKFEHYLEVNFEEAPDLKSIFLRDSNPVRIIADLEAVFRTSIQPGNTLIFLDEIQVCPEAIVSLRFFYEKMPELHVIAAGSLLEFALQEIPSFGVGRIRSLFFYPFSFDEFLLALGEHHLLDLKLAASPQNPLTEAVHQKLLWYLKRFILIGGMPESVARFVQSGNLETCQHVLDDLYISFKTDFAKYKKRVPVARLTEIFESVIHQAGGKFVLSKASAQSNFTQIKEALNLLEMAGLILPITHSSGNGLPLGAEADTRKRKYIPLDTGLFQRILGLNIPEFLLNEKAQIINKGPIAEMFAGLELTKYLSPYSPTALYYWHRETAGSNAEVDYLIAKDNQVVPVEVKASEKGGMQSLRQFLLEKKRAYGYRVSAENFSAYQDIQVIPLYALSYFRDRKN